MRTLLAQVDRALMERPAYAMSLAVAGAAFLAAVLTLIVNLLLPGLLAACGMLVVSLLYLGLALAYRDEPAIGTTSAMQRPRSAPPKTAAGRFKVDLDRDEANPLEQAAMVAEPDDEMMLSWLAVQRDFFEAVLRPTLPDEGLSDKEFALGSFRVTVVSGSATTAQQREAGHLRATGTAPSCDQGGQA